MEDFAFYVAAGEWMKLGGKGFFHMRGSLIEGEFPHEGLVCRSSRSGEEVALTEEGLRPSRAGLEGKMLSHAIQERVFNAAAKPKENVVGDILLSGYSIRQTHSVTVRLVQSMLKAEGHPLNVANEAVPVEIDGIRDRGSMLLNAEGTGQLTVISATEIDLEGELSLRLANQNVFADVAFKVQTC